MIKTSKSIFEKFRLAMSGAVIGLYLVKALEFFGIIVTPSAEQLGMGAGVVAVVAAIKFIHIA